MAEGEHFNALIVIDDCDTFFNLRLNNHTVLQSMLLDLQW